MPYVMSYTDSVGTVHAESWWLIGTLSGNYVNKTGSFQMFGYHSRSDYDAGASQLLDSPFSYSITIAEQFEETFGQARYGFPTLWSVEGVCMAQDAQGRPGSALIFAAGIFQSSFLPSSLTIGQEDDVKLYLVFANTIVSGTSDYLTGFSLTVNGTPVSITSAVRSGGTNSQITFTIPAITLGDELLLSYDSSLGNVYSVAESRPLPDINNLPAENLLGRTLYFIVKENTGLMLVVL